MMRKIIGYLILLIVPGLLIIVFDLHAKEWKPVKVKGGDCTTLEVNDDGEIRKADTKKPLITKTGKGGKVFCPV